MNNQIDFDLADILAESREFLENHGWARGEFMLVENEYDETGEEVVSWETVGYCAMGGVLYSQGISEDECIVDPRSRAVADALSRVLGLKTHHADECTESGTCSCVINWITHWNDDDAKDVQEVLDVFAKAEKIERAGYDPDAAA